MILSLFTSQLTNYMGNHVNLRRNNQRVRQYIEQPSMPEGLCWKIVRKRGKKLGQEHWSLQYAGPWIFYIKKQTMVR